MKMTAKSKYWVENTAGGVIYYGASEDRAIEATRDHFATPYIHSAAGARPVCAYELDGESYTEVGAIGESYECARTRLAADLARYGKRAYI